MLDSENTRLGRELVELQGRLALGERAEKEGRREALGLRQKLLKGEANLEAMRLEVIRWVGRLPGAGRVLRGGQGALCLSPTSGCQGWSHSERPLPRTCPCPHSLKFFPRYNGSNNNFKNCVAGVRGAL